VRDKQEEESSLEIQSNIDSIFTDYEDDDEPDPKNFGDESSIEGKP
jgi:hypothetical protein